MTQLILDTFVLQAEACEAMGSPFMGKLCRKFASHLDDTTAIGRLCLNWEGDPSPSADSVPLRICGGLHALVLSGLDTELNSQYPPNEDPNWTVVRDAFERHEAFLVDWMTSAPQTNEISRSGVLWPALMHIARATKKPIHLLEVGASAGLNLRLDKFSYRLGETECGDRSSLLHLAPQWKGNPVEAHDVQILSRAGCDLNPLDPLDEKDALRLNAYVWPDQTQRLERLHQAMTIAQENPAQIDKCDAVEWLRYKLTKLPSDGCTVIYSTVAWQYLSQQAQNEGAALIANAGDNSTLEQPLAWLRIEADGKSPGAGIDLTLYPHGEVIDLGRADFHGRWVDWAGIN